MIDSLLYDISDIPLDVQAAPDIASYLIEVYLIGRNGFNDAAVMGHMTLTGNEP